MHAHRGVNYLSQFAILYEKLVPGIDLQLFEIFVDPLHQPLLDGNHALHHILATANLRSEGVNYHSKGENFESGGVDLQSEGVNCHLMRVNIQSEGVQLLSEGVHLYLEGVDL
jgi:hypothetical protein